MRRPPFIGLGTGRCGTQSLARIVGACKSTKVAHERFRAVWLEPTPPLGLLSRDMNVFAEQGVLFGESNFSLLNHMEDFIKDVPDLKVVWMRRSIPDTVDSFMRWTADSPLLHPVGKVRLLKDGRRPDLLFSLPIIQAHDNRQAWRFYCEYYEAAMEELVKAVPTHIVGVEDLDEDAAVGGLFDFLEIPDADRVLIEKRCFNSEAEERAKLQEVASA